MSLLKRFQRRGRKPLTHYASCAGWAAKLSPEDLVEVLAHLPPMEHPDLLEGFDRFSDAGVYRLRDDLAIVQTVDFFPPIVDDPVYFGRIAAANALSDVYAMGGSPVTALSIVGFPSGDLDMDVLGEILAGGAEKVLEAGAVVVGGHSVVDSEVKFGLAVTGTVDPKRFVRNSGARPGDRLVLTKPLGMGSVSTAIKAGKIAADAIDRASEIMAMLNRDASDAMVALGVQGATDVTGFGLLGHGREIADASGVTLRFRSKDVPIFPEALDLARRRLLSGGSERNRGFLGDAVALDPGVNDTTAGVFFDSETSGGLLIAVHAERASALVDDLQAKGQSFAAVVGEVLPRGRHAVEVTP